MMGRHAVNVTVVVFALSLGACGWWSSRGGRSWPMTTVGNLPAASGQVTTRKWDGRERAVVVKVEHLAPANQAVSGATSYVVWFKSAQENAPAQNMGVLSLDQDLEGMLTANTSFVDFDVLVTAEASPTATQPSKDEIMRAQVRGPVPSS